MALPQKPAAQPSAPGLLGRLTAALLLVLFTATPSPADYVGSLVNRIFIDPVSIPQVADGFQVGDEIAYILETTPRDTGSDNGHAAWMTVYLPAGAVVIDAEFVRPATNGGYDPVPAEDTDASYDGWGARGSKGYLPTTGARQLGQGFVNEAQQDTGIFFSTDPRTALVVAGFGTLDPTGVPAQTIYNQWDYDQVLAYGIASALSGNKGTGNTPLLGTGCTGAGGVGCSWTGTGSIVAGPDTYYTNDYDPSCDPGSTAFVDDVGCVGPWQRIAHPNSKLGAAGAIAPATATGPIQNTSVPTAAGWDFAVDGPLPAATNVLRFVHGKRRLGEIETARIVLRITDASLFPSSFNDSTFCLDSTGGDTSDTAAKDNPWRYYEPQHECNFLAATANLFKEITHVNGQPSNGASLSPGEIISYRILFTNTSLETLTDIQLSDIAENLAGEPTSNLDLIEPGDPLCAWSSYDGDLPGPAYNLGSASTGTATWATLPSLGPGESVRLFLCAEVTGGGFGVRTENTAHATYTHSTGTVDLSSVAGGTISGSISGTVYNDVDGSGGLTPGDAGVGGVTVTLYLDNNGNGMLDGGDTLVDSVATLSDGTYTFAGLPSDGYIVVETDPVGWTSTGDKDNPGGSCGSGNGCNTIGTLTVSSTGASTLNDFFDQVPAAATNSISGTVFVDVDEDAIFEPGDGESGQGGVTVRLYRDNNADGQVDIGDTLIQTRVSDPFDGTYAFVLTEEGGFVLDVDPSTLPPGSSLTTDNVETASFAGFGSSDTANDFGLFGGAGSTGGICYAVADNADGADGDRLVSINDGGGGFVDIGPTGTLRIEAIAYRPGANALLAADSFGSGQPSTPGRLGTLNQGSGPFTPIGAGMGSCTLPAAQGGGTVVVHDVDGLSFDPFTGLLWATEREGDSAPDVDDLLLVLDPATGAVADDAVDPFGPGVTCVRVPTSAAFPGPPVLSDVDDIAVDPDDGQLYAIANRGGAPGDHLITIDKTTGAVTDIGALVDGSGLPVTDMEGLGFANDGELFGVTGAGSLDATDRNRLWSIDKSTGVVTLVAAFPLYSDYESVDCLTAGPNQILGTVFADQDGDQLYEPNPPANEIGQPGVTVRLYIDENGDDLVDPGDTLIQTTVTDGNGDYSFFLLGAQGSFVVDIDVGDLPAGAVLTTDNHEQADFVGFNNIETGNNFGFNIPGVPEISKASSAAGSAVVPGQLITYTLIPRVPSLALLPNVRVLDPIPIGTAFVGAFPAQSSGPDPLRWDLGSNTPGVPGVTAGTALCPVSVSLTAVADTFLQEDNATSNFGTANRIRTRPEPTKRKHGLVRFDLSSIPGNATVDVASLRLTSDNSRSNHAVEIRELVTPWSELGATWNTRDGATAWAGGGAFSSADYLSTVYGTFTPVGGSRELSADVMALVATWRSGSNNGLVMLATGTDTGDADWYPREEGTASRRPRLELVYRVPTPGGCSAVTTLTPTGDTFVQQDSATANFGTNSRLRTRPEATKLKHSLLKFQLAPIPPGATINSATFNIEVTSSRSNHFATLHRMLTPWTELGATWNTRDGATAWTGGGSFGTADYNAASEGTITPSSNGFQSIGLTSLVDGWVNGGLANQGLLMLAGGTDTGDAQYASRDEGDPARHPFLEVDWVLDPGDNTNTLSAAGTLVSDGDTIVVTMQLVADAGEANVVPGSLTVSGNGATATCGAPSPASRDLAAGVPGTFTWTCTAAAGGLGGSVTFSADATGDLGSFDPATSNSVLVSPPLTFQVQVDEPLDRNITRIVNSALATSDLTVPGTDTVSDPVSPGALIGDRVWLDSDGDGVQDVGEKGIANVVVRLVADPDGIPDSGDETVMAIATTGASGGYRFERIYPLPAGSYYVEVISGIPAGLTEAPGNNGGRSAAIVVVATEVHLDADFGYVPDPGTAVVGDLVWSDADGDGVQDPGERGVGGVTVNLLDAGSGAVVDTTTTAADGSYLFTGVAAGEYRVEVDPANFSGGALDGYTVTAGPQSPGADTTDPFTVAADDVFDDADFGYHNPSLFTLSDIVWLDGDGDGTLDPGESGIGGVTADLLDDLGNVIATTTTDGDGNLVFAGLENGDYTIRITDTAGKLAALAGTTAAARSFQLSETIADEDEANTSFGYNAPGTIGDILFSDADGDGVQDAGEPGIDGVTVELWLDADGDGIFDSTADTLVATTTTGADGRYLFEGLTPGTYFASVEDGQAALAGYSPTTTDDETGANAAGTQIEVVLADADAGFLDADFGYQDPELASVSGSVFEDLDADGRDDGPGEPGIAGVTVALLDASGTVVATATTDAGGGYSFTGIAAGDYTVAITDRAGVLVGYRLTSGLDAIAVSVGASDVTGIDFGYVRGGATGAIGDAVWLDLDGDGIQEASEPGLSGVTVALWQDSDGDGVLSAGDTQIATRVTDAAGRYLFAGVPAGSYFVDVDAATVPAGLVLTGGSDPSALIRLSQGERFDRADFGYGPAPGTAALGDSVFADADGDGVQDVGEVGIGGVTVNLLDDLGAPIASTVTAPDGSYLFTGLAPGIYQIQVDTTGLAPAYGTTPTNGQNPRTFDLSSGVTILHADFGFPPAAATGSIGDAVFLDQDGDGAQDPGEPGLPGVTLNLLDAGGNILATTTTGSGGAYDFLGLPAGGYRVEVTDIAGVLAGLNLSAGSNPTALITLGAGEDFNGADFAYAPSAGSGAIGGTVWHDTDKGSGDGVFDAGEPGFQGVTVELWLDVNGNGTIQPGVDNLIRTEITDDNGEYEFKGLPAGDYVVDVTDEQGVLSGFGLVVGPSPTLDGNGHVDPFGLTLGAGVSDLSVDFAYDAGGGSAIRGTTFFDAVGNAVMDGDDQGVGGVTVRLYRYDDLDMDGEPDADEPRFLIGVTTSTPDGQPGEGTYEFTDLPDGTYFVEVSPRGTFLDGTVQTTQTATGGVQPVTVAGGDSTGNDFGFNIAATLVLVSRFDGYVDSRNRLVVEWETASQAGTLGFYLYRWNAEREDWDAVHRPLLPAAIGAHQGALYRLVDEAADPRAEQQYALVEVEAGGVERSYGPFRVLPDWRRGLKTEDEMETGYRAAARQPSPALRRRLETARRARAAGAAPGPWLRGGRRPDRAGGDAPKVGVTRSDLYFVAAASLDPSRRPTPWAVPRLAHQGETIPWYPAADGSGLFFWGEATDSIYTRENVYWIRPGRGRVMATVDGGSPAPVGGPLAFRDRADFEQDRFAGIQVARDPESDYWFWEFVSAGSPSAAVRSFPLAVDGVAPFAGDATLRVSLFGATSTPADPDHHAVVRLNGVDIGEAFWDGTGAHVAELRFSQALLAQGDNTVEIEGVLDTGAPYSIFYLDSFELDYDRLFRAVGDRLVFRGDGSPVVTVSGFVSPDIQVFDITEPRAPRAVAGATIDAADGYRVSLVPWSPEAVYLAVTLSSAVAPASLREDRESDLRRPADGGADYLVVAPSELVAAAQALADYRQGRGLAARVVDLEDIYDEFNAGLASPEAVRGFLAWAWSEWPRPPRFVALAGKGSFDYRDQMGIGGNLVPALMVATPYGLYASDVRFADVAGDDRLPELAIGRIPVLTADELLAYVAKLELYEAGGGDLDDVLLLADNPDGSGDFPADSDALLPLLPQAVTAEAIYLSELPVGEARARLFDRLATDDIDFVNYIGHGGLDRLAGEGLVVSGDAPVFAAGGRTPVLAALTCTINRFEIPGFESLGEALVLEPEAGAVASWSPAGLSLNFEAAPLDRAFVEALYGGGAETLGEAVSLALESAAETARFPFMLEIYNLLGDPALTVRP